MKLREAAQALHARAMLRLQESNLDQAWADALAIHRLARLASQGPTLVGDLSAIAADGWACGADQALLQRGRLTADHAAKMCADLSALPPMATMVNKIDVSERLNALDLAAAFAP